MASFSVTLEWSRKRNKSNAAEAFRDWWDEVGYYILYRGSTVSYAGQSKVCTVSEALSKDKRTTGVKVCKIIRKSGNLTKKRIGEVERALVYYLQPWQNRNLKDQGPAISLIIRNEGARTPLPKKLKWDATKKKYFES